jgi:hypothetical protein
MDRLRPEIEPDACPGGVACADACANDPSGVTACLTDAVRMAVATAGEACHA